MIDREAFESRIRTLLAEGRPDDAATHALRTLGPEIQKLLWRVLSDLDVADDAFGIFSEQLWRNAGHFRAESSFRTWAYRLAWSAVARIRRDPHHRRGRRLETEAAARIVEEVREATSAHRRTEVKDRLRALRESLDPLDRAILSLRIDSGLSWRDVAEILAEQGQPLGEAALRKRYERAKSTLKRLAQQASEKRERD